METLPEEYSESFQKLFQSHERFILRLCEILKLDYAETDEEAILAEVKDLKATDEYWKGE